MFPVLYVFFGSLIGFFVIVNILSFVLALLGFGAKSVEEQRVRRIRM
jgi:hypothetical protein